MLILASGFCRISSIATCQISMYSCSCQSITSCRASAGTSPTVTYPCIWPLLEDENLDSLLVIGGIGPMPMRAMSSMSMASLQQADNAPDLIERAERMFQEYQEEEMRNLDKLFEYMERYQKPVLIFGMNPIMLKESPIYTKLREKGLMIYPTPERAAKTLAHLVQYSRYIHGG